MNIGIIASSIRNNRYWVGGGTNWNGTAGAKWAYTSGGTGGAPEPTNNNPVFFDANSSSGTITVSVIPAKTYSLNFTGFAGTFTGSTALSVKGSLILNSTMTYSLTSTITFNATSAGYIINPAGKTFRATNFNGAGGGWTLANNFINNSNPLTITSGTFSDGGFTVTTGTVVRAGTAVAALVKSGTWTFLGASDVVDIFGGIGTFTLTDNSSLWSFTNNSATNKTFNINSKTCYNVSIATAGTGFFIFAGSSSYNQISSAAARTIKFTAGTTSTINALAINGSAGNLTVLTSSSTSQFIITSNTNITVDYCNISYCNFVGISGATMTATNSTNGGNNSGISFI